MIYLDLQKDLNKSASLLTSRFDWAQNWRSPLDARCLDWYKLFISHIEPLPEGVNRSNLHIPYTYSTIDTIRSRIMKSLFASRPYISFVARGEDDVQNAKVHEQFLNYQLEQIKLYNEFYDYITNLLVYPCAVASVGWRYEDRLITRKEPIQVLGMTIGEREVKDIEVIWDDNEFINLDWFDFFPDPLGTNIDNARFVFQRDSQTRDELEDTLTWLEEMGAGTVEEPDWKELKDAGTEMKESKQDRLAMVGLSDESKNDSGEMGDDKFEVLHYWEDNQYAILVNRKKVVYAGENHYHHQKKPYVVSSFDPKPNEFYGFSLVQIIESLQHELNTTRNQRIDNVSMIINRMWKAKRGAEIDEADLVSRPNGIIWLNDPEGDLVSESMDDVTSSAYNEENLIKQDIQTATGTPEIVRAGQSEDSETATEASIKSQSAGIRFDVRIQLFENSGLKRMAELMDKNNQQFVDRPRVIRVTDDEETRWPEVSPEMLRGSFDHYPASTNTDPEVNQAVRRKQLTELLKVFRGDPDIDQYQLKKKVIEAYDIKDADKLMLSPQEKQQQMAAMAQQQQVLSQGQQGEGGQEMPQETKEGPETGRALTP